MGGLPRTRHRSIHASRNLSRAPSASLRDHFVIGYADPGQNPSAVRFGSSRVRGRGLGRAGQGRAWPDDPISGLGKHGLPGSELGIQVNAIRQVCFTQKADPARQVGLARRQRIDSALDPGGKSPYGWRAVQADDLEVQPPAIGCDALVQFVGDSAVGEELRGPVLAHEEREDFDAGDVRQVPVQTKVGTSAVFPRKRR